MKIIWLKNLKSKVWLTNIEMKHAQNANISHIFTPKKNPFPKPLLALLAAGLSKSLTTRRCMPSPMLNGSGPASRDGVAASWQETLATNANDMLKSSDEPEVLVETLIQMLMLGKKDAALCWCFCWSKGVYAPSVFFWLWRCFCGCGCWADLGRRMLLYSWVPTRFSKEVCWAGCWPP